MSVDDSIVVGGATGGGIHVLPPSSGLKPKRPASAFIENSKGTLNQHKCSSPLLGGAADFVISKKLNSTIK